jgi:hypothetical protein
MSAKKFKESLRLISTIMLVVIAAVVIVETVKLAIK